MINSVNSYSNNLYEQAAIRMLSKSSEAGTSNEAVADELPPTEAADSSASSNRRPPIPLEELVESMQQTSQRQINKLSEVNTGTSGDSISSIDTDGDGTISTDEYDILISQAGIKDAASAEEFFKQYDTDSNGEITSEEMDAGKPARPMKPMGPPPEKEQSATSSLDTNGDGIVSIEEYEAAMSDLGIEDTEAADALFDQYDTNSDGKITSDEILAQQKKDTEESTSARKDSEEYRKVDPRVLTAYKASDPDWYETGSSAINSMV